MDDLTSALAFVALIDLAVLALGSGLLIIWTRRFELSAPTLGGTWAGFLGAYVASLRWAVVPTYQIRETLFFAFVWGVIIGASVWLAVWLVGFLVKRRGSE